MVTSIFPYVTLKATGTFQGALIDAGAYAFLHGSSRGWKKCHHHGTAVRNQVSRHQPARQHLARLHESRGGSIQ